MVAGAGSVFVGRARELAELEGARDDARAGRGAAVLLGGDAGIGKTRLVSELAQRARTAGFVVLLGHSLDLAGTELPYHPFVEALRPWGQPWGDSGETGFGSKLRLFERTLSLLAERAASDPVLIVLEDVHWADVSTIDLTVYLAHHIDIHPILLIATARVDEIGSRDRIRILADGIRRSLTGHVVEMAPLDTDDVLALIEGASTAPLATVAAEAIAGRSEGNPFFVEELLTVAGSGEYPRLPLSLRDLLLHRISGLDGAALDVLRLASVVGRDVPYAALYQAAGAPEAVVRQSLRQAVERGILVAGPDSDGVQFRHSLLAEAVYATVLPGEREDLHARVAAYLATIPDAPPAELARHWTAARRPVDALPASIEAARRAVRMSGLAEAHGHLERAIRLWDEVPAAAEIAGLELAEVCAWAAQLADQIGAAPRAVVLARRAIELTPDESWQRVALLHVRLGEYLYGTAEDSASLDARARAVAVTREHPGSSERAHALSSLAGGLMVAWRFAESLPMAREALAQARAVGAQGAEVRALTVLGVDLVHFGHADEGIAILEEALALAERTGDLIGLEKAYVNLTDILATLGRQRAAARLGASGTAALRRHGVVSLVLTANHVEALLALGEWDECDRISSSALRAATASFPYMNPLLRADLETWRGDFDSARAHLDAARETMRADHGFGIFEAGVAELALWERRWTDAHRLLQEARARAGSDETALLRVWFCAKALWAQAELTALARDCHDAVATRRWTVMAQQVITDARRTAAIALRVTPNAGGWLALAEGEYSRAGGGTDAVPWEVAAVAWERLERPPLAAYCRWRETEALLGAGAARSEAAVPLRSAYAVATAIRAAPLARELEALARRVRLDPLAPARTQPPDPELTAALGLTPREAEVLTLVAQGCTNREIARTLVISEKTTGVHVTHILRKLDVPSRLQAAAIAHRLAPLPTRGTDGPTGS